MSQNLFPDGPEPASINGVEGPSAFVNADSRTGVVGGKPSMTVDQAASQLLRGEPGWSAALGVPATVTYAFRATAPTKMPSDTSGFSQFNAAQITQAEKALQAWSDVANITFVRVGCSWGSADVQIAPEIAKQPAQVCSSSPPPMLAEDRDAVPLASAPLGPQSRSLSWSGELST